MTTPANPDGSGTPAQQGWGEPPRYGQYGPGYGASDAVTPQAAPQQPDGPGGNGQDAPGNGQPGQWQGQYGQGQYGQSQYGRQQYGQQPPAGPAVPGNGQQQLAPLATVTDKPGIIPLRPLSLGEIYDGAFQSVRHNPGVVLGLTTLILTIASVIGAVISLPLTSIFSEAWGDLTDLAAGSDPEDLAAMQGMNALIPGLYGSAIGTMFTYMLAGPLAQGAVSVAVSESAIGRKLTMAEAWRRLGPRWWFLVGLGLLQGLVFLLFFTAVVALIVGMFAVDPGLGVIGALLGAAGVLVFTFWFLTKTLLMAPAMVLESQGFWATVRRGWLLIRGVFWRTLGIYLLTSVILSFLGQILSTPVSIAFSFGMMAADPIVLQIGYVLTMLLSTLLTTIFLGAVVALLYIDTRMRREGLDVQLAAAAAER